jgi:uncharacterized SAM-binding protein YcdF (DUF218 family)
VSVAAGADAFAAAIRRALAESTPSEVQRRIAVARENSWVSRIAAMKTLMDDALTRRATTRPRWDETLRRVYRRTRNRAALVTLALVAAYLLIFETNAVWRAAEPLKVSAAPTQADAIVVFAGGVGESGKAGGGAQERIRRAVDLHRAGFAPVLILSSGYVYSFREAEVMRALAVDQGVPASAIILEEHATNTYQNVKFVDDILRDRRWRRILLVSSPYHMRRALMVWRRQAPDVTVVPMPVEQSQFYDHGRGATFEQVGGILQEYAAIFAYWRRGWL